MKKYDALYIFTGVAKDDVLNANLEKALAEVTKLGGTVVSAESLGKRVFSRPMAKKESGVYVKVRLEMEPSAVATLRARYRLVEEVFRVQILAVDERREAKLVAEKAARDERQARREADAQTKSDAARTRTAEETEA
ncbi:MAG: 30S ribosomal protein S6 [Kiritimatiellae bacterium]|nr:30S ribosomal protein S6 [Kiritimatiellia bacterium]